MLEIRYCGTCGDQSVIEKMEGNLMKHTQLTEKDFKRVECSPCKLEIALDNNVVFNEAKEPLDINKVVERVKAELSQA